MNSSTASSTAPDGAIGLAALEQRLADDLECLGWPARRWMVPRTLDNEAVLDVAIIGGGQAGLAAAAALQQLGIAAVIYDRSPAGHEGPWASTARMETLRSPKELTGPALGLPALTFRAWFVAQWGGAAWRALDKIPRLQWMDYLRWYREVMRIELHNDVEVRDIRPRGDALVRLDLRSPGGEGTVLARRVVLATGRDGLGGPAVPAFVASLPRDRWAHSSQDMDYARLRGLRVGVVGAGSSAMDSAATALECGALSVDLLIRRADLPRINKSKGAGSPGNTHGHFGLPDEAKWRLRHYINSENVPPPRGSTQRVSRHPNVRFNLACPVQSVDWDGKAMTVHTPKGAFAFDFLIVSTGFRIDWARRPEFASIATHIRAWCDRYAPGADAADMELADSPDLGPVFEFQPKTPHACPGLERVHCFCYPSALSHGTVSGDIPAISDGARRLANGIAGLFYVEDFDQHFANLQAYDEPELLGDEWTPAPPPHGTVPPLRSDGAAPRKADAPDKLSTTP